MSRPTTSTNTHARGCAPSGRTTIGPATAWIVASWPRGTCVTPRADGSVPVPPIALPPPLATPPAALPPRAGVRRPRPQPRRELLGRVPQLLRIAPPDAVPLTPFDRLHDHHPADRG